MGSDGGGGDDTDDEQPGEADGQGDDELIAIGGDLEPETLLHSYRLGLFPMPLPTRGGPDVLAWWLPVRRGIIDVAGFRPDRSLRRARRGFEIRVDTAFEAVVDGCADPRRPYGWITLEVRDAYVRLHRLGHAHSVEAWADGELGGGLYGVAIGGLFAAESKFHVRTDASKAAVAGLVELLAASPDAAGRLIDTQWSTDHLARLGVIEVDRSEYARRLHAALQLPPLAWSGTVSSSPT